MNNFSVRKSCSGIIYHRRCMHFCAAVLPRGAVGRLHRARTKRHNIESKILLVSIIIADNVGHITNS